MVQGRTTRIPQETFQPDLLPRIKGSGCFAKYAPPEFLVLDRKSVGWPAIDEREDSKIQPVPHPV